MPPRRAAAEIQKLLRKHATEKVQRFTAALSALPAEKRGRRAALIFTGWPVRGLRPSRAARLTTRKCPKPMIFTSAPFLSAAVMASKVASTADAAAVLVMWALPATAAIS